MLQELGEERRRLWWLPGWSELPGLILASLGFWRLLLAKGSHRGGWSSSLLGRSAGGACLVRCRLPPPGLWQMSWLDAMREEIPATLARENLSITFTFPVTPSMFRWCKTNPTNPEGSSGAIWKYPSSCGPRWPLPCTALCGCWVVEERLQLFQTWCCRGTVKHWTCLAWGSSSLGG